MDYVSLIKNSVETSIALKIFKTIDDATQAHIFKSTLILLPLHIFRNINNFDPIRLKKSATNAYPVNNRPRGYADIISVKFYQKQIQHRINIPAIWLIKNENNKKYEGKPYVLLDGAHRIVASYIENTPFIFAYVIDN